MKFSVMQGSKNQPTKTFNEELRAKHTNEEPLHEENEHLSMKSVHTKEDLH
jgi:hypothetical protein